MKIAILLALGLAATLPAHAQPHKVDLFITCTTEHDQVGTSLCSALRDSIARSPRYSMVYAPKGAFEVNIVTVEAPSGEATATSTVLSFNGESITHIAQYCPTHEVGTCARNLLAKLDDDIQGMAQPGQPDWLQDDHQGATPSPRQHK